MNERLSSSLTRGFVALVATVGGAFLCPVIFWILLGFLAALALSFAVMVLAPIEVLIPRLHVTVILTDLMSHQLEWFSIGIESSLTGIAHACFGLGGVLFYASIVTAPALFVYQCGARPEEGEASKIEL